MRAASTSARLKPHAVSARCAALAPARALGAADGALCKGVGTTSAVNCAVNWVGTTSAASAAAFPGAVGIAAAAGTGGTGGDGGGGGGLGVRSAALTICTRCFTWKASGSSCMQ